METLDVAIIGAGPAGSRAAATLSCHGNLRIALFEKAPESKRNATLLTFTDVPVRYGLGDAVTERYADFSYVYPGRPALRFSYEDATLVAMDYRKMCSLLRKNAVTSGNVKLVPGEVTGLEEMEDGLDLALKDGSRIRSRYVIDASGKTHLACKALGLPLPALYSHVLGYYVEVPGEIPRPLAVFFSPHSDFGNGGGWLYSAGKHHVSFGYAAVRKFSEHPAGGLEKIFQAAREALSRDYPFLAEGKLLHVETGSIPLNPTGKLVQGRVAITGDAAALATNWMCMGIEPALWSGEAAARTIAANLLEPGDHDGTAPPYPEAWETRCGPAYREMTAFSHAFWSFSDSMWEFILQYDLQKLTPEKFLERMKHNAHRMSRGTFCWRYLLFRIKKMFGPGSREN